VRHAAIPVHLIQQARAAGTGADRQPPRALVDAPPDPAPAPTRTGALARRLVRWGAAAQRLARIAHRPAG
jgi:hypothetical protein